MKWHKMDREEKNNKYSKYFCNEINIFLFFKDRLFFDEIARPFIECKMEKSVVDYYLLGNYEEVIKYNNLLYINGLNSLELCFLVDALIRSDQDQ
jgi:hypothetical protein